MIVTQEICCSHSKLRGEWIVHMYDLVMYCLTFNHIVKTDDLNVSRVDKQAVRTLQDIIDLPVLKLSFPLQSS